MKDLITGIFFTSIGLLFYFYSLTYVYGSSSNIGPGYYPSLVSILLILLGLILSIKSLIKK